MDRGMRSESFGWNTKIKKIVLYHFSLSYFLSHPFFFHKNLSIWKSLYHKPPEINFLPLYFYKYRIWILRKCAFLFFIFYVPILNGYQACPPPLSLSLSLIFVFVILLTYFSMFGFLEIKVVSESVSVLLKGK